MSGELSDVWMTVFNMVKYLKNYFISVMKHSAGFALDLNPKLGW